MSREHADTTGACLPSVHVLKSIMAVQIVGTTATEHDKKAKDEWVQNAQQLSHEYMSKRGIDVGRCTIMVHVRPVEGLVRQLDGTLEKRFAKQELQVPLQVSPFPSLPLK